MTRFALLEVKPNSRPYSASPFGFPDAEPVPVPTYPHSIRGSEIQALRRAKHASIGQAAHALNMPASDLTGLESGRLTLSEADWQVLLEKLRGAL